SCLGYEGCNHITVGDGSPCSDGNACTQTDECLAGTCIPGPQLNCDDGNPCTDDSCEPAMGCHHANNNAPCDDGNACTAQDAFQGGSCQSGTARDCSDNNPCTDDSC